MSLAQLWCVWAQTCFVKFHSVLDTEDSVLQEGEKMKWVKRRKNYKSDFFFFFLASSWWSRPGFHLRSFQLSTTQTRRSVLLVIKIARIVQIKINILEVASEIVNLLLSMLVLINLFVRYVMLGCVLFMPRVCRSTSLILS